MKTLVLSLVCLFNQVSSFQFLRSALESDYGGNSNIQIASPFPLKLLYSSDAKLYGKPQFGVEWIIERRRRPRRAQETECIAGTSVSGLQWRRFHLRLCDIGKLRRKFWLFGWVGVARHTNHQCESLPVPMKTP